MKGLRARLARVPKFGRVVVGLVIGSVALVTALAYWQNRLGYRGIAVVCGVGLAALVGVVALPERAWTRVAGVDTLAGDLGVLHAEGARLLAALPWIPDPPTASEAKLKAWTDEADDWDVRVQTRLAGTRWLGTYLSPVVSFKTVTVGFGVASNYRNTLEDRLERLAQILTAIGGQK
jgi:hypothetical protein